MAEKHTLDVQALYAAFRGVRLHMGLVIDELRVAGTAVHLDREPFAIQLEQPAEVEIEISQESVADFLETQAPGGLRGFKVRCADGKVFVDATLRMLLEVPASAICTLRIDQGKRLFIDLEDVSVLGAGPRQLVQKQLDAINPVFDLEELPVDGELTSADVANGKILIRGTIAPRTTA